MVEYPVSFLFFVGVMVWGMYLLRDWFHNDVLNTMYRKYMISDKKYSIKHKHQLKWTLIHAYLCIVCFTLAIYFRYFC